MKQPFGQIIRVALPERKPKDHEQHGERPALLIADPNLVQALEYAMLLIAPITTRGLKLGALRVELEPGDGGLPEASTVLLDQFTAIDASRVRGFYGVLEGDRLEAVRAGLRTLLPGL